MSASQRLHRLSVLELGETDGAHRPVLGVHVLSGNQNGRESQRRLEVVRLDLLDVVGAAVLLDELRRARNENQEIVAAAQQSHHLHGSHV